MLLRFCFGSTALMAFAVSSFAALTPAEEKIVAAVNAQSATFARDLEQAVQIDSATENLAGVRKMADVFNAQLAALGLATQFVESPSPRGPTGHLVAEHRGTQGKRLLLIGHLDTVLPGGNYRRDANKALGSGSSDIKGGNLIMVAALRALHTAGALANTQIIVVMTSSTPPAAATSRSRSKAPSARPPPSPAAAACRGRSTSRAQPATRPAFFPPRWAPVPSTKRRASSKNSTPNCAPSTASPSIPR
jgi:glutamate carboxypeptidase